MTSYLPYIVTVATVIANAAIAYATIARHEKLLESLRQAVQELEKEVAVMKATRGLVE